MLGVGSDGSHAVGKLAEVMVGEPEPDEEQVAGEQQALDDAMQRAGLRLERGVLVTAEDQGVRLGDVAMQLEEPWLAAGRMAAGEHVEAARAVDCLERQLEARVVVRRHHLLEVESCKERVTDRVVTDVELLAHERRVLLAKLLFEALGDEQVVMQVVKRQGSAGARSHGLQQRGPVGQAGRLTGPGTDKDRQVSVGCLRSEGIRRLDLLLGELGPPGVVRRGTALHLCACRLDRGVVLAVGQHQRHVERQGRYLLVQDCHDCAHNRAALACEAALAGADQRHGHQRHRPPALHVNAL